MRTHNNLVKAKLMVCVVLFVALEGATVKAEGLGLSLHTVDTSSVIYTSNNIEVALIFTNNSTETVALLNHFAPIPVFFEFKLVKADGTVVAVPGSGKVSFYESSMQYVELGPGDVHGIPLNLAEVLREQLESVTYSGSVIYINQYGSNGFKV